MRALCLELKQNCVVDDALDNKRIEFDLPHQNLPVVDEKIIT